MIANSYVMGLLQKIKTGDVKKTKILYPHGAFEALIEKLPDSTYQVVWIGGNL